MNCAGAASSAPARAARSVDAATANAVGFVAVRGRVVRIPRTGQHSRLGAEGLSRFTELKWMESIGTCPGHRLLLLAN